MAKNQPPGDPSDEPRLRPTILLVEDDTAIANLLADVLESAGYIVRRAATGAAARAMVEELQPSLIVLDLVLPDEDGLVLCSVLNQMSDSPILICSGTQRRRDEFLSLKLGADDFIAKPFDMYDLLARVEVLLRRAAQHRAAAGAPPRTPIRIGELFIDPSPHQVSLGGNLLQLTPTEYRLLSVLAARPDQVVPRDTLAKLVWGDPDTGTSRTIDVHIGRLRVKLAQGSPNAPQIISVRGFGYKIVSSPPNASNSSFVGDAVTSS
ncbi:MAG TPA: response regulator transcription factor [Chloroflexota bacterium]|jgi:DNA-binding response OmpR family regulator|nr:response regulator transcription factor [Chloroflexota bacterium]